MEQSVLQMKCQDSFENAKRVDGFVEIKPLKVGGRTSIEANCCMECRMVAFQY